MALLGSLLGLQRAHFLLDSHIFLWTCFYIYASDANDTVTLLVLVLRGTGVVLRLISGIGMKVDPIWY